jgi:hypothetical protein
MIYLPDECHDFYCRPRFQDFFFFKQAFLFIKSVVKDVFVGVAFVLVTVCVQLFSNRLESVFVGARCIQEERFSQHEKRYYFDDDMAEIAFGLLFFLFCLFLIRLF